MKKSVLTILSALFIGILSISTPKHALAHCEVPCGIYDDSVRVALIKEHITTIEKSMTQINELTKSATPNYNQLIRWVMNKEEHAVKIQEITSQYFLHQRIKLTDPNDKPAFEKYQKQLVLLHQISVYSMKCKQTTDLANIKKLRELVSQFESSYFHSH